MIDLNLAVNSVELFSNYNSVIVSDGIYNMSADDIVKGMSSKYADKYMDLAGKMYAIGYIIDPRIVFDSKAYNFIATEVYPYFKFNYNTTFYKDWQEVTSRTRLHIWVDQLVHYISTYGTDYEGETLMPNDSPVTLLYNKECNFKVIKTTTLATVYNKFMSVLSTPIALSESNLQCMLICIKKYWNKCLNNQLITKEDIYNKVNNIKNKEAKCVLANEFNVKLTDPIDIIRYIWYFITGETQIVQTKEIENTVKGRLSYNNDTYMNIDGYLNSLSGDELIKLAEVYYRYKKIFIAIKSFAMFRRNNKLVNTLNRLSRYAKKHHVPCVPSLWESITEKHVMEQLCASIDRAEDCKYRFIDRMQKDAKSGRFSAFKAVKIYNKASQMLKDINMDSLYYIRNNKVYFKESDGYNSLSDSHKEMLEQLRLSCLYYVANQVHNYIKENDIKYIVMSDNAKITYTCPTSEKNFIGSVPVWSQLDLSESEHNIFGVYWRNEWGTYDFDLSAIDDTGSKMGWNGSYNKSDSDSHVIFSGDMTNADPEATECFYFRNYKKLPDILLFNNRYNGLVGSEFRLFFGQCKTDNFGMGYMVKPEDLLFQTDIISNKRQQMVGAISNNKFVFVNVDFGDKQVSESNYINNQLLQYINDITDTKLTFNDVFKYCYDLCSVVTKSKFEEIKKKNGTVSDDNMLDLDFSSLTKDTFINMMK